MVKRTDVFVALAALLSLLVLFEGGFDNLAVPYISLFTAALYIVSILALKNLLVPQGSRPIFAAAAALLVFSGISVFWSLDPHRTLTEFSAQLLAFLFFAAALHMEADDKRRFLQITVFTAAAVTVFALSVYLFLSSSRIIGTWTNPNPFATYLAMFFCLMLGWYLKEPGRGTFVLTAVFLAALVLTGSRGAYVAVGAVLPVLWFPGAVAVIRRRVLGTALVLAAGLLLTQLLLWAAPVIQESNRPAPELAAALLRPTSMVSSTTGRFSFWQAGIEAGLSRPLSGHGLGTFFLAYYLELPGDRWFSRFAHNHYVQTFTELGIAGLLLLLAFVGFALHNGWRAVRQTNNPPYVRGLWAALAVFIVHIALEFSWNFPAATVTFFAFVGLTTNSAGEGQNLSKGGRKLAVVLLAAALLFSGYFSWALYSFDQAAALESRGETETSVALLERTNRFYPINAGSFWMLSRQYQRLAAEEDDPRLWIQALEYARRAVELSPANSDMHLTLGHLYHRLEAGDQAEVHFTRAAAYAGHRVRPHLDLGWFFLTQGKTAEAVLALESGASTAEVALASTFAGSNRQQVEEELITVFALLYRLYSEQGQQESAEKQLQAIRAIDAGHFILQDLAP